MKILINAIFIAFMSFSFTACAFNNCQKENNTIEVLQRMVVEHKQKIELERIEHKGQMKIERLKCKEQIDEAIHRLFMKAMESKDPAVREWAIRTMGSPKIKKHLDASEKEFQEACERLKKKGKECSDTEIMLEIFAPED